VNYKVLCFSLMAARSSIFVGFPYVEFELQCVRLIRANLPGALGVGRVAANWMDPGMALVARLCVIPNRCKKYSYK